MVTPLRRRHSAAAVSSSSSHPNFHLTRVFVASLQLFNVVGSRVARGRVGHALTTSREFAI